MQVDVIADYANECGEGPLWHPDEKRLYWSDIPTGRMFRYDPVSGHHEQFLDGSIVGGFTLQVDGSLLLFMDKGTVKIWRDGVLTTVLDDIPDERETRFNDVFADPEGRVFCGTMPAPDRKGRLYRLDPDGSLRIVLEDIGVSNGMGFTLDMKQLYFTDTPSRNIYLFDYDQTTGAITNQHVFAQSSDAAGEGMPDGMTVDADGFVWSARWEGGCIVRHSPQGEEVARYPIPARKITSVMFGGNDLSDLYVTSAGGHIKDTDGPHAGALFRMRPGVKGQLEFRSKVGL